MSEWAFYIQKNTKKHCKGEHTMEHTKTKGCLDSLTLKLLAMALMLCDHL